MHTARSILSIACLILCTGVLCAAPVAYAQTLININMASAETLDLLPGVGPAIAARIIEYRNGPNGPFDAIEELKEVSGIGEVTYAEMASMLSVSGDHTLPEEPTTDTTAESNGASELKGAHTMEDADSSRNRSSVDREDEARIARLFASDTKLSMTIRGPSRAYVHRAVTFSITPEGLRPSELATMRYAWNFGDGTISDRRTPVHTYIAPGNYKVVAHTYRDGHEAVGEMAVTVLPISVSLDWTDEGKLLLHNDARYEVDVSGVTLMSAGDSFTLPEHTYLMPNASLTLSRAITGFTGAHMFVRAHDAAGTLLAQYPEVSAEVEPTAVPRSPVIGAPAARAVSASSPQTLVEAKDKGAVSSEPTVSVALAEVPVAAAAAASLSESVAPVSRASSFAPYALLGVIAIALLALYAHRLV